MLWFGGGAPPRSVVSPVKTRFFKTLCSPRLPVLPREFLPTRHYRSSAPRREGRYLAANRAPHGTQVARIWRGRIQEELADLRKVSFRAEFVLKAWILPRNSGKVGLLWQHYARTKRFKNWANTIDFLVTLA